MIRRDRDSETTRVHSWWEQSWFLSPDLSDSVASTLPSCGKSEGGKRELKEGIAQPLSPRGPEISRGLAQEQPAGKLKDLSPKACRVPSTSATISSPTAGLFGKKPQAGVWARRELQAAWSYCLPLPCTITETPAHARTLPAKEPQRIFITCELIPS